jgi:hypothetical protein
MYRRFTNRSQAEAYCYANQPYHSRWLVLRDDKTWDNHGVMAFMVVCPSNYQELLKQDYAVTILTEYN